jgi:cell division septation protein DedD
MKQKVKPVKKPVTQKKSTQFAIEMDVKGISFFMILGLGAALIVFYLGFTFGKATRDPNVASLQQSAQTQEAEEEKAIEVQKNLKIFNIREDSGSKIAALKKSSAETLNDANRIIEESKQESKIAQPAAAENKPVIKKKEPAFTPQWPDKAAKKKRNGVLYTYQIIVTKDIQKATKIVQGLKKKGFDAYKMNFELEDGRQLYRVRVGRGTKAELKSIEGDLKKVVSGVGNPKLTKFGK